MIIALKGTIGTGKTTLAQQLENKGYKVVNCDKIVHELYETDQELIRKISEKFNIKAKKRGLVSKKLKVDRKALGEVVFNDQEKMAELEAIVHPTLKAKMQAEITGNEKVVIDCQVVDKLGLDYDLAILLYANIDTIVKRIVERDKKDGELVKTIVNNQIKKEILSTRTYAIDSTNGVESVLSEMSKIKELKHD